MADLASVDPCGALILREQYMKAQKVDKVMMMMVEFLRSQEEDEEEREQIVEVAEATYHRWRKEALHEFGKLVGLC